MKLRGLITVLFFVLLAALTGCQTDSCVRLGSYGNCGTSACAACRDQCSAYRNELVSSTCSSELSCISNCLGFNIFAGEAAYCNQGTTTRCGCSEMCLHSQVCTQAFYNLTSCVTSNCQTACQ